MSANIKPTSRARRSDLATSHQAAAAAAEFSASHKQRILTALKVYGARSVRELEMLIGLSVVQIERRIAEMRRKGLIQVATDNGAALVRGGCTVWSTV